MQRNIRKLVLFAGLPLAAIGLVVLLLSWGAGSGQKVHATPLAGLDFSLTATGCNSNATDPTPTPSPSANCSFTGGSTFTVALNKNGTAAFSGYDALINYSGAINYIKGSMVQQGVGTWLDPGPLATQNANGCGFPVGDAGATGTPKTDATHLANGSVATACTQGTSATGDSTYSGPLLFFSVECKASGTGTISITHGPFNTDLVVASGGNTERDSGTEQLNITCKAATNTPVPPTVTPTPTAPTNPFVQKLPALQNVFLTAQGAKIPPRTCETGTDVATLNETISAPISSINKNGLQHLGAFEFEVRFDSKMVCVSIAAGPVFGGSGSIKPTPTGVICSTLTSPDKGLVRFGCVSVGKGTVIVPASGPAVIAVISVRPQPELFSQMRPGQSNGIPVQILNQGCQLSDDQGLPIPISSCEDADITFRFLEGDVTPDCIVNVFDAQNIASRWGATKGNLLFNPFMDLTPTGHGLNGDGRIDIQDLQFVFGRLGSQGFNVKGGNALCNGNGIEGTAPGNIWPPQRPVNPKLP